MKYIRLTSGIVAAILLLSTLCGCAGKNAASSAASTAPVTMPTALPMDVSTLLTSTQVKEATGQAVGEPQVMENGLMLVYYAENDDTLLLVELSVEQAPRTAFDAYADALTDGIQAPGIGEDARWSAALSSLLFYQNGYTVSLRLSDQLSTSADRRLTMARSMALNVVTHMQ